MLPCLWAVVCSAPKLSPRPAKCKGQLDPMPWEILCPILAHSLQQKKFVYINGSRETLASRSFSARSPCKSLGHWVHNPCKIHFDLKNSPCIWHVQVSLSHFSQLARDFKFVEVETRESLKCKFESPSECLCSSLWLCQSQAKRKLLSQQRCLQGCRAGLEAPKRMRF